MSRELAAVLTAAAAARGAAALWAPEPSLRFAKFGVLADRLRASGWLPEEPFAYSPAYTYLVAAVRAVAGDADVALAAVQAAVGCGAVAALWWLTRQAFGPRPALVAGLAAAVAAPLVQYAVAFESDGLGLALLLAGGAVAASAPAARGGAGWRLLAAGILLGLRTCQRPSGVLAVAVVAAVVALAGRPDGPRRRAAAALLVVAGAALPLAGVVTLNLHAAGGAVPVMSSSGWVLYTSHNHAATGLGYAPPPLALELKRSPLPDPVERMDDAVSRRIASWVEGRALDPAEASGFWRREALDRILERGAAAQLGRQIDRLHFMVHAYDAHDNAALAAQAERLRRWPLVGSGLLLPLGVAGLARWLARRRPGGMPALLAAALLLMPLASMTAFYVVARFRLELLALLLPFAAWGAVDLLPRHRPRSPAADATWATTAVVLLVVAYLPVEAVETHRRRTAVELETVRGELAPDLETAVFHLRRASELARYPAEAARADRRLGELLERLDRPAAAQVARLRADGLLPPAEVARLTRWTEDPDALWAVGRYRLLSHDPRGAASAFAKAHRLAPLDPEIGFSLAVALDAVVPAGDARIRDLTAASLRRGLRFSADAPRAWRLLARHELGLGDVHAAAAASLEAARLAATSPLSTSAASSR